MKVKIVIAFLLLFSGLAVLTDWIVFASKPENSRLEWNALKEKYVDHFWPFLQPLAQNAVLFTLVCMACFVVAGLIFISRQQRGYFILGIFSFVMAGWQLFSLM